MADGVVGSVEGEGVGRCGEAVLDVVEGESVGGNGRGDHLWVTDAAGLVGLERIRDSG